MKMLSLMLLTAMAAQPVVKKPPALPAFLQSDVAELKVDWQGSDALSASRGGHFSVWFAPGESFDGKRFVFRVDGVDMAPLILDATRAEGRLEIEKADGKALFEVAIYARGQKEAAYEDRVQFELPRAYVMGRSMVSGSTFKASRSNPERRRE